MNIVLSDIKDALVASGVKNKMRAIGSNLVIKLNDDNLLIIEQSYGNLQYTVEVYETGYTLETNCIKVPNFIPKYIPEDRVQGNRAGIDYGCYYYIDKQGNNETIYESQDLLELIPNVIDEILEVIDFYNKS